MTLTLIAAGDDNGRRLDRILRKTLRELPLSAIYRLLREKAVRIDGKTAAANDRVRAGQTIAMELDNDVPVISPGNNLKPQGTEAPDILFEGSGLLVLNKPAGLVVHGKGGRKGSLEDQVRSWLAPKIPSSLSFRPGPLHRLDKPSSGIIVFSASLEGARYFSALMRERKIRKFYLALIGGIIEKDEIWEDELYRDREKGITFTLRQSRNRPTSCRTPPLSGEETQAAYTRVSPLAGNKEYTLIAAEIETGRTHQIRAQAAARGHPLAGDVKYGGLAINGGAINGAMMNSCFFLHSWRMEFPPGVPPGDPPLPHTIRAPVPEKFLEKIRTCFGSIPGDVS